MASTSGSLGSGGEKRLNRRVFLKGSAGVAGGVAVTLVPSAAALALAAPAGAAERPAAAIDPVVTGVPSEPVMAFVRDEAAGEVTVMSGTLERTYRDPVLVKRLLAAAAQGASSLEVK